MRRHGVDRAGRILYRRGQLGDVVLLGSVTKALGAVEVATDPRWHPVVERLEGVTRVHAATRWRRGMVDLQGELASLGRPRIHKRSLRRRLRLHLGWPGPRPTVPTLYAEAVGIQPARAPWLAVDPGPRDTLAVLPGASTELKRPPMALLRQIAERWQGPVVLLGSPEERVDLPGEPLFEHGFDKTLGVLGRVAVAIGGDTGLLHLAGAAGAWCVALFGPTHPDDGFFVYRGKVVQRELPCRPCTLHRGTVCQLGQRRCLDLDVERVWEAVCAGSC